MLNNFLKSVTGSVLLKYLLGVVIIITGLCSCAKKSTKANFFSACPPGWTEKDNFTKEGKREIVFYHDHPIMEKFADNILVTNEYSKGNLDENLREMSVDMKKSTNYYREEQRTKLMINGCEARCSLSTEIFKSSITKIKYQQEIYLIKDPGADQIYMIVATAPEGRIRDLQSSIDKVVNTFRILPVKN